MVERKQEGAAILIPSRLGPTMLLMHQHMDTRTSQLGCNLNMFRRQPNTLAQSSSHTQRQCRQCTAVLASHTHL